MSRYKPYPVYKDSGVEWIGKVPEHWEQTRLKFLTAEPMQNGVGESGQFGKPEWPRYVRITDIADTRQLREDTFATLPPEMARQAEFRCGDLLLAAVGATYGRSYLHESDCGPVCFAGYLVRFSPKEGISSSFVSYWTESSQYWGLLASRVVQSTIQNFSAAKYKDLPIAIPHFDEQASIASALDRETARIDALISRKTRFIELLQEKRQALITHAVTKGIDPNVKMKDSGVEWIGEVPEHWEVLALKRLGTLKGGNGFPPSMQGREGNEFPFYKVGDLGKSIDGMNLGETRHSISKEDAANLGATIFKPGALAWAKIGAALSLNRRRVIRSACCLDNNMTGFTPDASVASTTYCFYLLSSIDFSLHAKPGAVPSFSEGDQGELMVTFPSPEEQCGIVNFLDRETARIDAMIAKTQRSIDLLKERRSAFITAAVTGQIDLRETA